MVVYRGKIVLMYQTEESNYPKILIQNQETKLIFSIMWNLYIQNSKDYCEF